MEVCALCGEGVLERVVLMQVVPAYGLLHLSLRCRLLLQSYGAGRVFSLVQGLDRWAPLPQP